MSKTIDERVVEMRFDNRQFESNVSTTMSTLDKLKQKLNFTGATKGLEDLNSATKKVDMNGLGNSVETVRAKFSALQVMGVTALTNITNTAINAGKRIVSALTIDPIRSGFSEYELKMGSIQTIMASTGESLETVNGYLNELNEYSDRTIYSFSDMTNNIGKFTNAGVKLEDAVLAIKGISNEAAVSGANANEASRAMYNFAQALSAGYVKLIDWKSIENANMATVEFKEQLIDTAVKMGTLTKTTDGYLTKADTAITATKNFNDSLKDEWMTSEVLIETLKLYADETTDIGKKAYASAQDVKTLSQLFDTLKESAQSGWAQTWEIVVGDFSEAKSFFTSLSKVLGGIVDAMSDMRNKFVGDTLKSSWEKLTDKIQEAGISTDKFQDKIKELAKKHDVNLDKMIKKEGSFEAALQKAFNDKKLNKSILSEALKSLTGEILGTTDAAKGTTKATGDMAEQMKKYGKIVDKVIQGDFGNGKVRIEKLTEAGYDYATIQNLVNEKLGISIRHTSKLTEEQIKNADSLSKLSDKQLKNKGFTDEQVKALRSLSEEADKAGTSISDLIDNFDKPSGRSLLIDTLKNVWDAITKIFNGIKEAWNETFDSNASDGLYGMLETIHTFSEGLTDIEGAVDKITRIAKGVFAFTKLFTSFGTKLGLVIFDIVRGLFGLTNLDILELIAKIGDAIVKVKDLIFNNKLLKIDLDKVAEAVVNCIAAFTGWINKFLELPGVQRTINGIKDAVNGVVNAFTGLFNGSTSIGEFFDKIIDTIPFLRELIDLIEKWIDKLMQIPKVQDGVNVVLDIFSGISDKFSEAYDIGKNIIEGIKQGLKDGTMTLGQAIINIGKMLIECICSVLGIHSPSREFYEIGKNVILGLVNGIKDAFVFVWNALKTLGQKMVEYVNSIDFGALLAAGIGVGMLLLVHQITKVVDKLATPFDKLGGMFSSIGGMFDSIGDGLESKFKAQAWEHRSKALKNMAISIGILAASVVVLSKIDTGKLWATIGAIGALAGIMLILTFASSKMNSVGDFGKQTTGILAMSASLLILAIAMKKLASIDGEDVPTILMTFTAMIIGLSGVLLAMGALVSNKGAVYIDKAGVMILKMSAAMLLMVAAIKMASGLDAGSVGKGLGVIAAVEALFIGVVAVSKFAGKHAAKAGSMILMMSGAFIIMVGVIKMISGLNADEITKGLIVIAVIEALFAGVIAVSKFAGEHAAKAGVMLITMAGAVAIMVSVIKQISRIDNGDVARGLGVVAAIEVLFAGIIAVSNLAGPNAMKAGVMLLTMSGALLILTGVLFILSKMPSDGMGRAVGIITVLEVLFGGLIAVTHLATDCKSTLITLTVAIGVLVASLILLSLIDAKTLATVSASLTAVIGVFALLVAATGQLKGVKSMIGPMAVMLVVVAGLAAILWALSELEVESSLETAAALSLLLTAMAASLAILRLAGKNAMSGVGALAVMGLVVAELAVILGLMAHFDINPSIETAMALSVLLTAMSASLVLLGAVGLMGPAAFIGVGALATLIAGIGALVVGIGALVDKFPALEKFLDTGIPVLEKIGYALGSFFGNIVGGFTSGITSGLPEMGTDLSNFMTNAKPFFDGISGASSEALNGVKTLAEMILILTGADLLSSITSWIGGDKTSLSEFGKELVPFGESFAKFAESINGVNPSAVEASANAAKALAEMAKTLPNVGGLASLFAGENDLGTFAKGLVPFGKSLVEYSKSVDGVNTESIATSVTAAKGVVEVANAIPKDGMFGTDGIDDFGRNVVTFGKAIKSYGTEVDGLNVTAVTTSVAAAKSLVKVAKAIPDDGTFGTDGIDNFGDNIVDFAKSLKKYSDKVTDINTSAISSSATAVKKAVNAINSTADVNASGVESFKNALKSLSKSNIDGFVNAFNGASTKLSKAGSNMMDSLVKGLNNKKSTLTKTATTIIDAMLKAINDKKAQFQVAGIESMSKFINGVSKNKSRAERTMASIAKATASSSRDSYQSFYSAGSYLVSGFANGISANSYKAAAKARAMASAAATAAKRELNEHSPSRVFYGIGDYAGLGFVNALADYASKAYNAGSNMADQARSGLSNAIGKIADVINSDMDTQPTIRPVLDLSAVSAGAGYINDMFGMTPSVGVLSNVGAINTMMSRRQNGANADVVSAIKDLKKSLGDLSRDQYNINGVSYDDGSSISDAVQALVRAIILEGRV